MATKQLEGGFTALSNELLGALAAYRIPGEQMQCLLFIIRKTLGYGKKEDMIANSQFCRATGLDKGNVGRAIRGLLSRNIVVKNDNTRIPTYRINKNYSTWKPLSKMTTVVKSDNSLLSKVTPTKETLTKEKKILSGKHPRRPVPFSEIVSYLNEKTGTNYRPTTGTTKAAIRARFNEGFSLEDFKTVIDAKVAEWSTDAKMVQFLRPQTLFGTKFESYLQAAKNGNNGSGRSCSTCDYQRRGVCSKSTVCPAYIKGSA